MASDPSTPLLRVDPSSGVVTVDEPLLAYTDTWLAPGDVLTVETLRGDPVTGRTVRETRTYRRDRLCKAVHGSHLFTRLLSPGRMVCLRCREVRPAP
jgi:hypothetical protein